MGLDLSTWRRTQGSGEQERVAELGDELCRQAAHLAAAEYRWLRLLEEFDRLGGWAAQGARSCAAWLSFACGVGLMAARERVRVARALPALPMVCQRFSAGELSYSKVRALTRVATPANEELLVAYALSSTAAQLETVVRAYRRSSHAIDANAAHERFQRRSLRWSTDEDGFVRIRARLTPEDGAVVVEQLERLAESLGEDHSPSPTEPSSPGDLTAGEHSRGDLPVVGDPWAASDPLEARRADALRLMAETTAATGPTVQRGGETHLVVVHAALDELREDGGGGVAADPAGVGTRLEDDQHVSAETARRLGCDASITALVTDALGRPLGAGRRSEKVSPRLRRVLRRRDGGCRFPGCLARRFVDAHHIRHWADGGPTELDNLVLLCRFHHRLVHEVGYTISSADDDGFVFRRPDGSLVPTEAPKHRGDPGRPGADSLAAGLTVTALTAVPDWDGSPPDYSMAVELLSTASQATSVP